MNIKQILSNSIWFGVIPRLSMLVSIIIMPLITPFLTPFDYGIYGLISSYAGIFVIFATLGLNVTLANSYYVYKEHFPKVWGRVLFILLLSGAIFSLIYGLVMFFIISDISGWTKFATIFLACIPIALVANITLAQPYYTITYNPKPLVLRNLLAAILGLTILFISVYYFRLGFLGWFISAAVSSVVTFMIFIYPLKVNGIVPIRTIKLRTLSKWMKVALPIIPHTLGALFLSSSDRIIMNFLGVSTSDIGLYSNGYQMGGYALILSTAIIVSVAPRIQELYRANDFLQLRKLFWVCQTFVILCSILFAIWMPQIYQSLIRNSELQSASSIATIICFANIVLPFYSFVSALSFINEKTMKLLWLVFVPGVLNVILNLIFIPMYGFQAAIYTTIAAYWTQLVIPYFIPYFRKGVFLLLGNNWISIVLLLGYIFITIGSLYCSSLSVKYKLYISLFSAIVIVCYFMKNKNYSY